MFNLQNVPVVSYETWMAALTSSACIGFTSLVPWLFNMTFFEHGKKDEGSGDGRMKFLLSFAVGAILGDIFFHLIPESFQSHLVELNDSRSTAHKKIGLSVVAGIFMFIIVEMILDKWSHSVGTEHDPTIEINQRLAESTKQSAILDAQIPIFTKKDLTQIVRSSITDENSRKFLENNNNVWADFNLPESVRNHNNITDANSNFINNNNPTEINDQHLKFRKRDTLQSASGGQSIVPTKIKNIDLIQVDPKDIIFKPQECQIIDTAGYLSLIANGFDNFTHGLAIGASFLVGAKVGLLTTFVIFIHEIPHEICDYAILVNSGFSRWDAVKAQSSVSLFGILGTATALYVKSVQILNAKTVWILPFSAGGFLYIALVNLLPEILDQKTDLRDSLGQIACVILGIAFMASVTFI